MIGLRSTDIRFSSIRYLALLRMDTVTKQLDPDIELNLPLMRKPEATVERKAQIQQDVYITQQQQQQFLWPINSHTLNKQ